MNFLSRTFDGYFTWAGTLAPVYFYGLLRLFLTFGLPAALTGLAFARGNRSIFLQVLACVAGLLLAATLPVENIEFHNRFVRGWIIALTFAILLFLPAFLAFLLVRHLGAQRKVAVILYVLLAGLMVGILAQKGNAP
jgi:hypothetical protein